jgi:hypothetical protein
MTTQEQAFIQGFADKCASCNIDATELYKFAARGDQIKKILDYFKSGWGSHSHLASKVGDKGTELGFRIDMNMLPDNLFRGKLDSDTFFSAEDNRKRLAQDARDLLRYYRESKKTHTYPWTRNTQLPR